MRAKHHDESEPPSLQKLMHSSIAFAGNRDSHDVCVVVVYVLTIYLYVGRNPFKLDSQAMLYERDEPAGDLGPIHIVE